MSHRFFKTRADSRVAPQRFVLSPCLLALSGLFVFAPCIPAHAQTATSSEDSILMLGTVEVNAARTGTLSARSILSSVDILGSNIVETQQVDNSWELFAHAPGVMLTQFKQGNVSGKFSFRAFNGEGEINAVKLLIDGIPSNANDGGMPFLDMIFPLDIESIEVVRGTNDPRYGLHNIAGNANVITHTGGNYSNARLTYGSFDTREVQVSKGMESRGWSQNYFAAYRKSDGYRDHANAEKLSLAGKWFYTTEDDRYRLGLIARHYENNAQEPGYLTAGDAYRAPTLSYPLSNTDGGNRQMNQVSTHFDAELSNTLSWSAKTYVNTLNDVRWIKFSAAESQQQRVTDERQYGATTTLTYRPKVSWVRDFALEGGMDVQRQENKSLRYRTANRVQQAQTRDQDFSFDVYGAYVQAVIKPVESLKLIPAYRIDSIGGDFVNKLNGQPAAINDYGLIKQPKISVVYSPWEAANLYANWGRTFQVGAGSVAYKIPPLTADLKPSINDGWETGVKFKPAPWVDGRIAYWQQTASDEVRRKLNDPNGDSDNVGKTRRHGYDFQFNLRPEKRTSIWLAYSRQYSRIVEPDPSAPVTRGKEIDHVPHYLVSGGIDFQATPELRLSAWSYGQGSYYLERANTQGKYGGYMLFNLGASYQVSRTVSLDFQIKNVANRYYEYVWTDGTQSLHSPGDGRAFYGTVSMKF